MSGESPETVEDLLAQAVAVLARACAGKDALRLSRPRAFRAPQRLASAGRMRPFAARVARHAAAGDLAGADRLLQGRLTAGEWHQLALLLASAADPGRLEEHPQARGRRVA